VLLATGRQANEVRLMPRAVVEEEQHHQMAMMDGDGGDLKSSDACRWFDVSCIEVMQRASKGVSEIEGHHLALSTSTLHPVLNGESGGRRE